MKNVVLIGASGFVGTAILNELLNRGNKVTAIVRNPEKITISNCNLSVVKADVSDVKTITDTCREKMLSSALIIPVGQILPFTKKR